MGSIPISGAKFIVNSRSKSFERLRQKQGSEMQEYIIGVSPVGKRNQVESKSHKVNTASLGSMARTYGSRSLYKQRWGKSPHNAFSNLSKENSLLHRIRARRTDVTVNH